MWGLSDISSLDSSLGFLISSLDVVFSGNHILRQTVSICSSVVMLILITWSRFYPVSPVYKYSFSFLATSQKSTGRSQMAQISCSSSKLLPTWSTHWWFLPYPAFATMVCKRWLSNSSTTSLFTCWHSASRHKHEYSICLIYHIYYWYGFMNSGGFF